MAANPRGPFNAVFDTDKIEPFKYFQPYVRIAAELGPSARVCEIGVESGESLRMWRALFPTGEVTGVDIDPACVAPDASIRIITASQDDPALPGLVGSCDLIIDDACHFGEVTRRTFDNMWQCVQPGGYYVIEDWFNSFVAADLVSPGYDTGMLEMTADLIRLLDRPGNEYDSVTFRFGLAIIKRRHY